jgi:hypothetical protein
VHIFLSSTYVDLVEHRQAAANALERLGQQVGRMEIFGSRPTEPLDACVNEIDECDLFVGIYAHRYGHIPTGSQQSITEQEFQRARKQEKPLFCYLIDDTYDWPVNLVEAAPGSSKLHAFKRRIRETLVVDFFREPLDLAVKVATAIGRHLIKRPDLLVARAKGATERNQCEELIALLESRRPAVLSAFDSDAESKNRFLQLHERNIEAIRTGELLLSHLLTADIHLLINSVVRNQRAKESVSKGSSDILYESEPMYHIYDSSPIPKFIPFYPYDAQFPNDRRHHEWSLSSGWYLRHEHMRVTASDYKSQQLSSWRDQLLNDWLNLELKPLHAALMEQRQLADLERSADARGVLKARLRPDGAARCPYCDFRIVTSAKVEERERCPVCRTYIELAEQVAPTEYQGHRILEGICIRCGGSLGAIRHFGFECK